MDQETLVRDQVDSGQGLIDRLQAENFDVTAAFWIKSSKDGRWLLYIASSVVDDEGLAAAYRKLYGVLGNMPDSWVFRSDVKLIGTANPVTKDVLEFRKKWPGPTPTWYRGRQLGNMFIDEAYIYSVG